MSAKVERLTTLIESHTRDFDPNVSISAQSWGMALSAIAHLGWFSLSLGRIHWRLERTYHNAQRRMSADTLPREEMLALTTLYGDAAARLFRLADNDGTVVGRLSEVLELRDLAAIGVTRWCYRKMAYYHELAGCRAEDNAETLALSASEPFAALVRRELDGQT